MTKESERNKIANINGVVKTNSNSGNYSELSDKDFLFKDAHSKTRRIIATIVGFIASLIAMAYWPLILLFGDTIHLHGIVIIILFIGGLFGFGYLIFMNKRNRFSPNWKNYLIVPVLGTILCIYVINHHSFRNTERMSPDCLFNFSIVFTAIFYYVKVIHFNTMAWVDDFFSNNSYIHFTTRVIEKHIDTHKDSKYYKFTVINRKLQKHTFKINDYIDNCEDFYERLLPGVTVIRLKVKQTIINDTEPLVKEFEISDSITETTDAEALQNLETKDIDDDQKIEDDNLTKWGCTFYITFGSYILSAIIDKILSTPKSYHENFHEWNYAYAIIGIVIAAIWLIKSFMDQKAKGNPENIIVQKYRLPMDFTTMCVIVFSCGKVIISIVGGIVHFFE